MDNGTREGLDKFLRAASTDPDTVLHYEFMQDYKVFNALFTRAVAVGVVFEFWRLCVKDQSLKCVCF